MQGNISGKNGKTGGVDINGIIEQYKVSAGENVSAGDFVSFVNKNSLISFEKNASLYTSTGSGFWSTAVELSENKVFIAFCGNSKSSSFNALIGVVCKIENGNITKGSYMTINEKHSHADIIKISDNKVFVIYNKAKSTNTYYVYGTFCTIDDTVITVGDTIQLGTKQALFGYFYSSSVQLITNSIFTAYLGYDGNTYAQISTINNNDVVTGKVVQISSLDLRTLLCIKLTANKIFIVANGSNSLEYVLYGAVCTIDGDTISCGGFKKISLKREGENYTAIKLSDNKIFIAHQYVTWTGSNSFTPATGGIICSINGTEIVAKQSCKILDAVPNKIKLEILDNNKVFMCMLNNAGLVWTTYTIYGDNIITDSTSTTLVNDAEDYFSVLKLSNNKILITYNKTTNNQFYAIILNIDTLKIKTTNSNQETIDGISKTSGTEGQTIEVYTPNI